MTLVAIGELCPSCHSTTHHEILEQPALFIACGYGATQRMTVRHCRRCGWALDVERPETRP